jgi:hypothetical protein
MNYSSRFWLYAPISTFLLLAAAVMVYWHLADSAFEKKLAAIKGHEAIPGVTLDWDKVDVGGFPFRIDAAFTNFRATGAGARGPFAWKSERFALHALTYGRRQVIYEAAGRQALRFALADGVNSSLSFQVGSLRASSINNTKGLARFDLDMADASDPGWALSRFQFHMRRDPDARNLDLMFELDGLQLQIRPGIAGLTLHLKPGNLSFYASLSRLDVLEDLLGGKASWPQTAERWRALGGKATLSQIKRGAVTVITPQILTSPLY